MRSVAALAFCFALAVGLVSHAHPDHGGKGDHAHDQGDAEVTDTQKKKRLERVIRQAERRQRNRPQRAKDRRMHLRTRLGRHLKGADITPELQAELKRHAYRTALIRQIRYVAAVQEDYDTVAKADMVFARENKNHEKWWRTAVRDARAKP